VGDTVLRNPLIVWLGEMLRHVLAATRAALLPPRCLVRAASSATMCLLLVRVIPMPFRTAAARGGISASTLSYFVAAFAASIAIQCRALLYSLALPSCLLHRHLTKISKKFRLIGPLNVLDKNFVEVTALSQCSTKRSLFPFHLRARS